MINHHIGSLDLTGESGDHVELDIQPRPNGKVLYVHVNGQTVLRICRITTPLILNGEEM